MGSATVLTKRTDTIRLALTYVHVTTLAASIVIGLWKIEIAYDDHNITLHVNMRHRQIPIRGLFKLIMRMYLLCL